MDTYQMLVCGVGGQGILTITDVIVIAAQNKGLHILGSEVHGMAQKGGSVVTNLKIGKVLNSPSTPIGTCAAIVGLEQNETLRYLRYLKPGGTVVTSKTILFPIVWKKDKKTAALAREKIEENLAKFEAKVIRINAEELAMEAGLSLAQNIVLLGTLSQVEGFPLSTTELKEALKIRVPAKYIDENLKAFELGVRAFSKT